MKMTLITFQSTFDLKSTQFPHVYIFFHIAMLHAKLTHIWCGNVPLVYKYKQLHGYFPISFKISSSCLYIQGFYGVKLINC